jgi:hypothetical protein
VHGPVIVAASTKLPLAIESCACAGSLRRLSGDAPWACSDKTVSPGLEVSPVSDLLESWLIQVWISSGLLVDTAMCYCMEYFFY